MHRTTVDLDDDLAGRLARISREQGRPEEEIIREAIAGYETPTGDRDFALAKAQTERRDRDPRRIWEIPDDELMAGFGGDAPAG